MPLKYLLYRCPECGHEPVEGDADVMSCPSCKTRYARGGVGRLIRVETPGVPSKEVPGIELVRAIDAHGGPMDRATSEDGTIDDRAAVLVRRSYVEEPVRYRGRLLGFAERLSKAVPGTLRLTDSCLIVDEDGSEALCIGLLEIRAVQTSSSSLQVTNPSGELIQLRFSEDSPRRWEQLLKAALQRAYREAGRGEIVEFQPRIVTE